MGPQRRGQPPPQRNVYPPACPAGAGPGTGPYFEMRSFPLAFVQFGLFRVQRVLEQGLGSGFELDGPVPHGEQVQRRAVRIRAFPALPKQARSGRWGARGGQTPAAGTGRLLPRPVPTRPASQAPAPGCGRGGRGEGPASHGAGTSTATWKSVMFASVPLRRRGLRKPRAGLRARSWGGSTGLASVGLAGPPGGRLEGSPSPPTAVRAPAPPTPPPPAALPGASPGEASVWQGRTAASLWRVPPPAGAPARLPAPPGERRPCLPPLGPGPQLPSGGLLPLPRRPRSRAPRILLRLLGDGSSEAAPARP